MGYVVGKKVGYVVGKEVGSVVGKKVGYVVGKKAGSVVGKKVGSVVGKTNRLTLINRVVYCSEMVSEISGIFKELVTLQTHGDDLFVVHVVQMSVVFASGGKHFLLMWFCN